MIDLCLPTEGFKVASVAQMRETLVFVGVHALLKGCEWPRKAVSSCIHNWLDNRLKCLIVKRLLSRVSVVKILP